MAEDYLEEMAKVYTFSCKNHSSQTIGIRSPTEYWSKSTTPAAISVHALGSIFK